MKMILVLSTSTGKASTEMLTGVREFAQGTDWNIQSIEFNGHPFPVRDLIRFWSPVGCIVEASGNSLKPGMIPHRAFGTTPVVYIGGDTTLTPANATCVTHNAVAVGEAAARELLTLGFSQFAFIGWKGHAWSQLRKDAFSAALKLNGRDMASIDLPSIEKGLPLLKRWLAPRPKPCGILAANDAIAEMTLTACRLLSISVPDEVAVIGVDDDEAICEHTVPTLTSIRQDYENGGYSACAMLAEMIANPRAKPHQLSYGVECVTKRASSCVCEDKRVLKAIEFIRRHACERINLDDVASEMGCSRRLATRVFRQSQGQSILDSIHEERLKRVRVLLKNPNQDFKSLPDFCGYRSLVDLQRVFKSRTGETLGEYRRHTTI